MKVGHPGNMYIEIKSGLTLIAFLKPTFSYHTFQGFQFRNSSHKSRIKLQVCRIIFFHFFKFPFVKLSKLGNPTSKKLLVRKFKSAPSF